MLKCANITPATPAKNAETENTISLNARSTALAWVSAIQTAKSAELSLEYAKKSWQQMNQRYKNGIISSSI